MNTAQVRKLEPPPPDFIRLELTKDERIKLRFRHKEIRKAVVASGNRSIGDIVADAFAGWPFLLAEGHRPFNPQVTLDMASDWMDTWVKKPNPETGEPRTLDELGLLLLDALKASGFIAVQAEVKDTNKEPAEDAEGNA